jgi:hypothetical protein
MPGREEADILISIRSFRRAITQELDRRERELERRARTLRSMIRVRGDSSGQADVRRETWRSASDIRLYPGGSL